MCWRAAQRLIHHRKILKGDNVMVTTGKDRGGTGAVKHVIRSQNRLIVEGKNQPLFGPKDTPMDLVLEKTYDAKTGKGMPHPINLLFNFIGDI
ncbi:uncharacterized protein LOC114269174 [Camellia sinensis]|uniref:uncharacterized protein LOC114269174 n=1 Tax=Camellia sinensis TaxID=4442 RepID=UPI001036CA64|nr:uncharacterized protein LOC114269174 [Camellia sinensis]